jgi:tetratricopeptide (TPR) repeat protein
MSTHIESIGNIGTANFNFANDKPSLPSNIPSPKGFIGREVELAALRQAKTDGKPSFVLHGIGGVGKTDLALKFIEEIKADYSAHIRVDMFGLSDKPTTANDAKLEVIRMFKPDVPANLEDKDINNLYISLLNQHKTILFFDNAKDREQVEPLNNASAFVVITSRATFNVSSGFSLPVEPMSETDARKLLYEITNDEARYDGQADALAYLAGYLPMALLPLGSLLAEYDTLEAVDLVAKYKDRKERLQLADPNRENLTVMASFDLSYERLSEELQTCWRKLAVFPADFDLEAMQAVWQIEDGKTISGELVKKHLLEFNKDTKRFHLHDLSRDYTGEKLSDEERVNAEYFHSYYYGQLLASLNKVSIENLDRFDFERTNIEFGFDWLIDKVEINDNIATICGFYVGFSTLLLTIRLHISKFVEWQEIGLKAARKIGLKQGEACQLSSLGIAHTNLGKFREAIEFHNKSLLIFKEIGNRNAESNEFGNLGNNYHRLGEYQNAFDYQLNALKISTDIEDRQGECIHLGNLGNACNGLGEHQKAIVYFHQSLNIAEELTDIQSKGHNFGSLGITYDILGEHRKAIDYYEQALTISQEMADQRSEGNRLGNIGTSYLSLREYEKAINYYQMALKISQEIGDLLIEGTQFANIGSWFENLSDFVNAKIYYVKALIILEAIESSNAEIVRQSLARLE